MHLVFQDREDAGKQLSKKLAEYGGSDALILGIPRGGVPVAVSVARRLQLEWNIIVARKLPIPWNPEAGFGAVTANGTVVLNDELVRGMRMSKDVVKKVAKEIKAEVIYRTEVFEDARTPAKVAGRDVIVIDDGIASGYTMLAAVKALKAHGAGKVVAAAPVASRSAVSLLENVADEVVFEVISSAVPFAVADFYLYWHDLTDDDVIIYLKSS